VVAISCRGPDRVAAQLDRAEVIPYGIAMGGLVISLNVITSVGSGAFLILPVGYLVMPMNALLQHRGANLIGAGAGSQCRTSRAGVHPDRRSTAMARIGFAPRSRCSAFWSQRRCG
jgi:hypothetical protein